MNLEDMLKERDFIYDRKEEMNIIDSKSGGHIQKAEKSATLFDFIKMVDKLVKLTMPKVKFIPDEGRILSLDAMEKFEEPVITYKILNRVPKKEIKPRVRELVSEKDVIDNTERTGEVWGQKFKCSVQFNIFASVYTEAEEVMEKFEEIIIKHAGFFKRNGVAEIIFDEHTTDSHYDILRETLSVRNLKYYVEIEKLTVMFKEKIQEIELLAQQDQEQEEEN